MCGIGGYIAFGEKPPEKSLVVRVFLSLQSRGTDAAGIISFDSAGSPLRVLKSPGSARRFVETEQFKRYQLGKRCVFHTRAATSGSPKLNVNNHPLLGRGYGVVHNGCLRNHRELIKNRKWEAKGTVDSEVFAHILDTEWKPKTISKVFRDVQGSYAVVALRKDGTVLMFRHSNPLDLYYDAVDDVLWFASTETHLSPVFKKKTIHGIEFNDGGHFMEFKDDSMMVWDMDGLLHSKEYELKDSDKGGWYSGNVPRKQYPSCSTPSEEWKSSWLPRSQRQMSDTSFSYGANAEKVNIPSTPGGRTQVLYKGVYMTMADYNKALVLEAEKEQRKNRLIMVECPSCYSPTPYDPGSLFNNCAMCGIPFDNGDNLVEHVNEDADITVPPTSNASLSIATNSPFNDTGDTDEQTPGIPPDDAAYLRNED